MKNKFTQKNIAPGMGTNIKRINDNKDVKETECDAGNATEVRKNRSC